MCAATRILCVRNNAEIEPVAYPSVGIASTYAGNVFSVTSLVILPVPDPRATLLNNCSTILNIQLDPGCVLQLTIHRYVTMFDRACSPRNEVPEVVPRMTMSSAVVKIHLYTKNRDGNSHDSKNCFKIYRLKKITSSGDSVFRHILIKNYYFNFLPQCFHKNLIKANKKIFSTSFFF